MDMIRTHAAPRLAGFSGHQRRRTQYQKSRLSLYKGDFMTSLGIKSARQDKQAPAAQPTAGLSWHEARCPKKIKTRRSSFVYSSNSGGSARGRHMLTSPDEKIRLTRLPSQQWPRWLSVSLARLPSGLARGSTCLRKRFLDCSIYN
ncbi:hypothetical protein F444_09515 [Phytophthora nicotianae P1976]|uniref:Uncharacterized protein n=1 Tax=Phytophthora nicotianae P1976 TaxID=1317066 RepID=A0A081A7H2_PHYNI|nr:hypothetical protein F444_09515 [Phytophthora nicotianae P1976]